MNSTEREILNALTELDQLVRQMKTANPKPNLLPLFERLDRLALQLGTKADRLLHHYLEKKSYDKARLHLEGREAENARGSCGH